MSILKVPIGVCHQLDQLSQKFWWNIDLEKSTYFSPIHLLQLCYPKQLGRMRFRKFEDNNTALLTKIAWQLQSNHGKLWISTFKSKYLQGTDLKLPYPLNLGLGSGKEL